MSAYSNGSQRRMGMARALTLAEEQGERQELAFALKRVAQYERKMQLIEDANELRAAGMGGLPKRGRLPEYLQDHLLEEVEVKRTSRVHVRELIDKVIHKMQHSLKRYHLRKRACAVWSLGCSEAEFFSLFGGYCSIQRHIHSKRLYVCFRGKDTADVNDALGKVLDVTSAEKYWYCRRYYGQNLGRDRDCAYIDVDHSHAKRKHVLFSLKTEKTTHLDRRGVRRSTSFSKLYCSYPRSATPVKPSKRFLKKKRKVSKASGLAGRAVAGEGSSSTAKQGKKRRK